MREEVRRSGRKEMNVYTDLNFPQWEHIMHRQLIPIGEVGIYNNAIHNIISTDLNSYTGKADYYGTHVVQNKCCALQENLVSKQLTL